MDASRKAITHRWFAVFGLFVLLGLINLVAMIPLGIGLIWFLPLTVIAGGILYRNIFGCEAQTLSNSTVVVAIGRATLATTGCRSPLKACSQPVDTSRISAAA
jgi:hypothetical protein